MLDFIKCPVKFIVVCVGANTRNLRCVPSHAFLHHYQCFSVTESWRYGLRQAIKSNKRPSTIFTFAFECVNFVITVNGKPCNNVKMKCTTSCGNVCKIIVGICDNNDNVYFKHILLHSFLKLGFCSLNSKTCATG